MPSSWIQKCVDETMSDPDAIFISTLIRRREEVLSVLKKIEHDLPHDDKCHYRTKRIPSNICNCWKREVNAVIAKNK